MYALKLGQFGSHRMKLKDAASWLPNHLDRVERLGATAGPDARAAAAPLEAQRRAPRRVPDGGAQDAALGGRAAGGRRGCTTRSTTSCAATAPPCASTTCWPSIPWELTTDWTYVRFHGPDARRPGLPGPIRARRPVLAGRALATGSAEGHDVYAYFNNDDSGYAVEDARWLADRLRRS